MSEDEDRLRDVPDLALDQAGLIVLDERHDVAARHVTVIDDRETIPIEIEVDAADLASRDGRSDRSRVKKARKGQIVDVARTARDLLQAFLPKHVLSNRVSRRHRLEIILQPSSSCR